MINEGFLWTASKLCAKWEEVATRLGQHPLLPVSLVGTSGAMRSARIRLVGIQSRLKGQFSMSPTGCLSPVFGGRDGVRELSAVSGRTSGAGLL